MVKSLSFRSGGFSMTAALTRADPYDAKTLFFHCGTSKFLCLRVASFGCVRQ